MKHFRSRIHSLTIADDLHLILRLTHLHFHGVNVNFSFLCMGLALFQPFELLSPFFRALTEAFCSFLSFGFIGAIIFVFSVHSIQLIPQPSFAFAHNR
mgnify:CR=1 FL=1